MDHFADLSAITDIYRPAFDKRYHYFFPTIRILVVVDTDIGITPAPNAFGIGKMIAYVRAAKAGCLRFNITLARRPAKNQGNQPLKTNNSPAVTEPKYSNFHFDDVDADGKVIIDQFHEVWCFGFKPDNFGQTDANITLPENNPLTASELEAIARFMDVKKGGVFATGDHDYLGASMCMNIPRIRTMRRWTNADNVPPIGGKFDPDTHLRIDTNRPATPGQKSTINPDVIPFTNQGDDLPQEIEWVPEQTQLIGPFHQRKRPHPVLCHPYLGVIDIMPDHPHEGLCFDNHEIDLNGTISYDGSSKPEYPTHNGVQPKPKIIAYGNTTPDPPYNLAKGTSPARRFPMISVYDGHPAKVGRVATDSTWHHWMDLNLIGMENDADQTNYLKVMRYFVNLAAWLAPPSIRLRCIVLEIQQAQFKYIGLQEWNRSINIQDLGLSARHYLTKHAGPCWITEFIGPWIREVHPEIWERLLRGPNPCLTCPPIELLENIVLGSIVRSTIEPTERIKAQIHRGGDIDKLLDMEKIEVQVLQDLSEALAEYSQTLIDSHQNEIERLKPFARAKTYQAK